MRRRRCDWTTCRERGRTIVESSRLRFAATAWNRIVAHAFPELSAEHVRRALDGDRAALADLYGTYAPVVRRAVAAAMRRRSMSLHELDDLVSEVWTRFVADGCRRLHGFDATRGTFGYYVRMRAYAVANALVDRRARAREIEHGDPPASSGDDDPEDRMVGRQTLARLWDALATQLSRAELALFAAVFVEGRFVREVAASMGLTEAVVYRRRHRLRRKIDRIVASLPT
jgi:RNA polymerase sigma factor (sigma-70 family)